VKRLRSPALLATASLAEALVPFFVGVLVARIGGPEALGRLAIAMALLLVAVTASELGQNVVLTRRVASGDPRARAGLGASLTLKAGATLALVPAIAWAWPADEPAWGILAAAAQLGLSSANISATAALRGRGRFGQVALASLAGAAVGLLGLTFVRSGQLSVALGVLAAAQSAKASVAFGWLPRDERPLWPRASDLRALVAETLPFAGIVVLGVAYLKADVLLLASMTGAAEAGRYAAAARLLEALKLLPTSLGGALFPDLAAGRWDDLRRSLVATAALGAVVMLAASLAGEPALAAVFGPAFAASVAPLRILAACFALGSLSGLLVLALYARHDESGALRALTLALGIKLAANLGLAPTFGATGVAWASLLSEAVLFASYLRRLAQPAVGRVQPFAEWASAGGPSS